MRQRRTFRQWFADARPRIVPAGCAVALFAVTAICLVAVVAPNMRFLMGSGAHAPTRTPNTAAQRDQSYQMVLPTAPASAIKLPRTPTLPSTALFATLAKAKMQNTCAVATPPATPGAGLATPTATGQAPATGTGTATASPAATATDTPVPTATVGVSQPQATPTCQACPVYLGNNPSQPDIAAALTAAAQKYGVPANLLMAVAWQESRWHADVLSCDGGIGLMQIQYYTYPWLNSVDEPICGLSATTDDPYTLDGNADLGAKYIKWLSCFYSYWGDNGGASLASPGAYTIAWYYQQAGLQYPDALNADGSTNASSFCAAVFNDQSQPQYAALPSTTGDVWSCPYSATTGDNTLLDMTLSAYNEGAGYTDQYGIQNRWYVNGVEGWIPQFASGSLPTQS
ncbi:MAG: transglycosylase SLT domain-containing protein [Chloroflexota bacterium]|nr:transglycosylase SLT domain-containing protein [Chloroflexota bacterium]